MQILELHCRLRWESWRAVGWAASLRPATLLRPSSGALCGTGLTWVCSALLYSLASHTACHNASQQGSPLHASSLRVPPAVADPPVTRTFGADDPWAGSGREPRRAMRMCFEVFTDLGRISAGFAARLVQAGALGALMRLAGESTALRLEAAGRGEPAILPVMIVMGCVAAFGRFVPRVSCRHHSRR